MHFRFLKVCLCLVTLHGAACVQTKRELQEYINSPVNLTITLVATNTYQLSFYSDNREGGFSGYGIFTGASFDSVNTDAQNIPADTGSAQAFCPLGSQGQYTLPVAIQVGPAAAGVTAGTAIYDVTTLTLTSGSYVGLRARVERPDKAWSAAAIAQVP